jgi:glycosyltransferase involved in cell wall biosynthesis
LSVPKGAHVLQGLAREASRRRAPFDFRLIGDSPNAKALKQAGVEVTGFYRAEDLDRLIEEASPHVVFLPSIWPETWSFVLGAALGHGLPVVAFDIGAPAERLRRLGRGHLLPAKLASTPADLLAAFRRLRDGWIVEPTATARLRPAETAGFEV